MPVSVTSTANVDPYAASGPMSGTFTSSPVYNKPLLDLENPMHLAVLAGAGLLVALWLKQRKK